jgi:hypothetical protein
MTMLRQLNQSHATGRVCGINTLGVLAEDIPQTGEHGGGYAANDVTLPADNGKHVCAPIVTWPASGDFFAFEDTSFEFTPAGDGIVTAQYMRQLDGVEAGPYTITLQSGDAGVTIIGTLGTADANGLPANIALNTNVAAAAGVVAASGQSAAVDQGLMVQGSTAEATAGGMAANIEQGTIIASGAGVGSATGKRASIGDGSLIDLPESRIYRGFAERRIFRAH